MNEDEYAIDEWKKHQQQQRKKERKKKNPTNNGFYCSGDCCRVCHIQQCRIAFFVLNRCISYTPAVHFGRLTFRGIPSISKVFHQIWPNKIAIASNDSIVDGDNDNNDGNNKLRAIYSHKIMRYTTKKKIHMCAIVYVLTHTHVVVGGDLIEIKLSHFTLFIVINVCVRARTLFSLYPCGFFLFTIFFSS